MGRIFTFKNKRRMPMFLAKILAFFLQLYAWTLRLTIEDPEDSISSMKNFPRVMVFWHNRVLFIMPLFPKSFRKYATPLVSASRDGEYIATIAKCFGIATVRGSSSKGGAAAMLSFHTGIQDKISPVLAVDGPRGPKYCVHPGAAQLAKLHNIPVMPFTINARHYWQLKSWDRMQIPLPFSRVTLKIGKLFPIPADTPLPTANDMIAKALHDVSGTDA